MSMEPLTLLAQLGLSEQFLWGLRFVAGLVGAGLGWAVSGPLTRVLYWIIVRRTTPGWVIPWGKLCGAMVVGLLVFFLIPLGGGSGLGWGPGGGSGHGKGAGDGGETNVAVTPPTKSEPNNRPRTKGSKDLVEIEVLGGKNYNNDERYYLLNRTGSPRTLGEIDEFLLKNRARIEVDIVLTEQSVARTHGAVTRLSKALDEAQIHHVVKEEGVQPRPES